MEDTGFSEVAVVQVYRGESQTELVVMEKESPKDLDGVPLKALTGF